jgi:predicted nuclease of predicted toxin-antitoxin system
LKFLIDRCAGTLLPMRLRALGHDVAEVRDRGPDPGDRVILQWGATEGRIVVTMDKDFGQFLFVENSPHCGLVRLPDVPSSERIRLMESLLISHVQFLSDGSVITVRGGRIRVSRTS